MFKTRDLGMSAWLDVVGYPIRDIQLGTHKNKKVAEFLFDDSTQLRVALENYQRGSTKIEPKEYFQAIKNTKNRMYQKINEA